MFLGPRRQAAGESKGAGGLPADPGHSVDPGFGSMRRGGEGESVRDVWDGDQSCERQEGCVERSR